MALVLSPDGSLPPNQQSATLGEVLGAFAYANSQRAYLGCLLAEICEEVWADGAGALLVAGSFVTSKDLPADLDCAVLMPRNLKSSVRYTRHAGGGASCGADLRYCRSLEEYVVWSSFFQMEKAGRIKHGTVEIRPAWPVAGEQHEQDADTETGPDSRSEATSRIESEKVSYMASELSKDLLAMQSQQRGPLRGALDLSVRVLSQHDPTKIAPQVVAGLDMGWLTKRDLDPESVDLRGVNLEAATDHVRHLLTTRLMGLEQGTRDQIYDNLLAVRGDHRVDNCIDMILEKAKSRT